MTFNRSGLGNLYKRESDLNVKKRLLLVLKVEVDGKISAHVAKELNRSRTCFRLAGMIKESKD